MTSPVEIKKPEEEIVELLTAGELTRVEIAEMFGYGRTSIDKIAQRNGLAGPSIAEKRQAREDRIRRAGELAESGMCKHEIADAMGLHPSTVGNYLIHLGMHDVRDGRETNIEKVHRLHQSGVSIDKIASMLHRKVETIEGYLRDADRPGRLVCDECGRRGRLERFRKRNLCPECLNADEVPLSLGYAMAMANRATGGKFLTPQDRIGRR